MKSKTKKQSEYITTTELAGLCGVSRHTIINWVKNGKIDCVTTIGGHRRIRRSEAADVVKMLEGEKEKTVQAPDRCTGDMDETAENVEVRAEDIEKISEEIVDREPEEAMEEKKRLLKRMSYGVGRGFGGIRQGLGNMKRSLMGKRGG